MLRKSGRLHPLSLLLFLSAYRGQDPATNFALNSCAVMRDRYLQAPFADEPGRLGLEWGALPSWWERGWRVGLESEAGSIHESYTSFGMLWQKLVYNGNAQAEGRTQLNELGPVSYWLAAIRQSLRSAAGGGRNLLLPRRSDQLYACMVIACFVPAYLYGTFLHARGVEVPDVSSILARVASAPQEPLRRPPPRGTTPAPVTGGHWSFGGRLLSCP